MRGKRALRRAARLALVVGAAWYRGQKITRASAAQLVSPESVAELTQTPHRADERVCEKLERNTCQARQRSAWKQRALKVWSFNVESLRRVGRMDELLELARAEDVVIFTMQGTQMDLGKTWKSGSFEVHSLARSGKGQRDGCLTAINLKFFQKGEVRCEHAWLEGKLQGVRLRSINKRRYERDIYVLNGYAPTNEAGHVPKGVEAM
eukprot:9455366-Pyramimonas_sp.AAC.1